MKEGSLNHSKRYYRISGPFLDLLYFEALFPNSGASQALGAGSLLGIIRLLQPGGICVGAARSRLVIHQPTKRQVSQVETPSKGIFYRDPC